MGFDILKIFRSYDFLGNKIINAKVDLPTDVKHIASKEYVDAVKKGTVIADVTLNIGTNQIVHNLKSTNILLFYRIKDNENTELNNLVLVGLKYKIVDEDKITIESKLALTGDLVLVNH